MSDMITKCSAAIRFRTDEIHDYASKSEIVKLVICANCREIPYKPIYVCQNGHVVCTACRGFNFRCGTCSAVVTDTRNLVAENLVMSFVFKCKYQEEGCTKLLSSTEVFKHLTNECEFRPISCTESMKEKCKGKQILYKNFLQHLRDTHGIRKIRPTDSCIKRVFNSEAVNQNISWPLFCFEYDGRAFFQHIVLNQLTAYIWVSCFNLPDHVNYIATVVVKNAAAVSFRTLLRNPVN